MDGNNSKFTIEEHSVREIDVKWWAKRISCPCVFRCVKSA